MDIIQTTLPLEAFFVSGSWRRFLFIGEIDTSIETVVRDFRTGGRFAHMEHTKFYVGQKVYDEALFPGVEGVVRGTTSTIIVRFGDDERIYYEGGVYLKGLAPTLFPEPYEVKRPEPLPEPGTFVYCWDGDVERPSASSGGYFIEKVVDGHRVKMPTGSRMLWKHIALENPFPKKIKL